MKGLVVIACAVVVLAGFSLASNSGATDDGNADTRPAPVKVTLVQAQEQSLPRYLRSVGSLESMNQVSIASEVAGRVTAIRFESGTSVQAGQLLITLNAAPEEARRAQLAAMLRNEEQRFERIRQLVPGQAISQEDMDRAEANRGAARGALDEVNAVLDQKRIKAPFAGTVGIRRVHLGQYLNPGDPIASLSDNRQLLVNFAVDEQVASEIRLGQRATLRVPAAPDQAYSAQVSAIDPILDAARRVQVQAILETHPAGLSAGMFADVQLERPTAGPVVSVPQTAIVATGYGDIAYVARSSGEGLKIERVNVEVGERHAGLVEVRHGLRAGDSVVASGQLKLADGMLVEASVPADSQQVSLDEQVLR